LVDCLAGAEPVDECLEPGEAGACGFGGVGLVFQRGDGPADRLPAGALGDVGQDGDGDRSRVLPEHGRGAVVCAGGDGLELVDDALPVGVELAAAAAVVGLCAINVCRFFL
jgi:hypothetical protein